MSRSNCGSSLTVLITLATLAACSALAATPDAPASMTGAILDVNGASYLRT
jgi:hypothetical protein